MKITIYTIPDCPFCKQEKEYLTSKSLSFDEKNVQENKDALAEMLQISNNFAGVPFTLIEKDGGEKVMLKGFTQSEFDEALGSMSAATIAPVATSSPAVAPAPATTPSAPLETSQPAASTGGMAADMSSGMPSASAPLGVAPAPVASMNDASVASAPAPTPTTPSVPPTAPLTTAPAQEPQDALNDLLAGIQTPGTGAANTAPAAPAPTSTGDMLGSAGDSMSAPAPVIPSGTPSMPPATTMPAASTAPAASANELKPEIPNIPDFGKAN